MQCGDHTKVVARSGSLSIFAALQECCPGCVRDEATTSGRRGLTMIEFNKALERGGFAKMRDRRVDATTREEDPTGGVFVVREFVVICVVCVAFPGDQSC